MTEDERGPNEKNMTDYVACYYPQFSEQLPFNLASTQQSGH